MFHGPHQSLRENDPNYKKRYVKVNLTTNTQDGHDTEFLRFQTNEYTRTYKNCVKYKSIEAFTRLTKNQATPPMQKNESGTYYLPKKK
jgi:hypothetical protein